MKEPSAHKKFPKPFSWIRLLEVVVLTGVCVSGGWYAAFMIARQDISKKFDDAMGHFLRKQREMHHALPFHWEPSAVKLQHTWFGFTITAAPDAQCLPLQLTFSSTLWQWFFSKTLTVTAAMVGQAPRSPTENLLQTMLLPGQSMYAPQNLPLTARISLKDPPYLRQLSGTFFSPKDRKVIASVHYHCGDAGKKTGSFQGSMHLQLVEMLRNFFPIVGSMVRALGPMGSAIAQALHEDLPVLKEQNLFLDLHFRGDIEVNFPDTKNVTWDVRNISQGGFSLTAFEKDLIRITFEETFDAKPGQQAGATPVAEASGPAATSDAPRHLQGVLDFSALEEQWKNLCSVARHSHEAGETARIPIISHIPHPLRQSLAEALHQGLGIFQKTILRKNHPGPRPFSFTFHGTLSDGLKRIPTEILQRLAAPQHSSVVPDVSGQSSQDASIGLRQDASTGEKNSLKKAGS